MDRHFLMGLDEVSSDLNKGYDKGLKNENIAYFAKLLKVKTMRVWLNYHEIFKIVEGDKIEFLFDGLIRLNNYLTEMKKAGVERFELLTWGFLYPFGYKAGDKFTVPDPIKEQDMYQRFLKIQSNLAFEIARNYSEIQYFEPTNEPDGPGGVNIHRNSLIYSKDNLEYDMPTIQRIVLDLCYASKKGATKGNKRCKVVFPGFCNLDFTCDYLDGIYSLIESQTCPTFGRKSNVIEDYFDVMNWHPYNLKDAEINDYWFSTIDNIRNVMKKHNDIDRTIWFNEIGWSDLRRETEYPIIAERYQKLLEALKERLTFVETFFPFRLFTLANKPECEGEDNFGLVYNEYDWDKPFFPKPCYLTLYKWVNGQDADLSPCYSLARVKNPELFRFKIENPNKNAFKVLFLGNAITYRKEAPWNGLNEGRGLGSTLLKNDYVHRVVRALEEKYKNVQSTAVDCYSWEKTFYDKEVLDKLSEFNKDNPDLVIIMLGDNYGGASLNDHEVGDFYTKLINRFKTDKNKVICLTSLGTVDKAITSMKKSALDNEVEMIDISYMKDDSELLLENGYINRLYQVVPNDNGHKHIAEQIIKLL